MNMPKTFVISVADVEVFNRYNEIICSGKTMIDSGFEKGIVSGKYLPEKKTYNMSVCDIKYYKIKNYPYPEKVRIICQIVSMKSNRSNIQNASFVIDKIYLYNDYREIEKIINKKKTFIIRYNDDYRKIE